MFWFESARRRLAKDPLRPPPSSWRGRGTGYPHPPWALKAGFDSSWARGGGAAGKGGRGTRASHGRPRPRAGGNPGRPRSGAAAGAGASPSRAKRSLPCKVVRINPERGPGGGARPGAPGWAGSPCRRRRRTRTRTDRGAGKSPVPPAPQAGGFLSPERLARAFCPRSVPCKLHELSHFIYFGLDFMFFHERFKQLYKTVTGFPLGENTHIENQKAKLPEYRHILKF